ncbi:UDP-glucose 4-epimerase [Sphingomonas vulcanisoli]|uniref:UDP-glucose 4-epimerase n=1 Tax=Sphingomonas vulcanisoli TaxID=1658060 RepID=A0ABX0TS55_9SPHN|nr:UDP-glucose 4-epimerase GalE [Sphingomonas vulcanisoli]NIJ07370.1 UDP-glucose 4-epimerase [Sphingomonas vulcanisoli]
MLGRSDKPFSVLVTGGAGYIGSHAVLALLDAGWKVVVLDNLATGFRWAVPETVEFVLGDVADMEMVQATIAKHNIGAILHFAGSLLVGESVGNPLKYYRNNTAASRTLIEAAIGAGVHHFVFSSTAATYGMPEVVPVAEDAPKAPINPYGLSKLMTEQILADVAAAHPLNYAALRYFNVAGADPQGRSGQSVAGATHLIHIACEAATGKRGHVGIYGDDYPTPDGTGVRDYIHVSDLADAHVAALEWLIANPSESLTANVGYGRGYSVLEVLDVVDHVTNMAIERRQEPRRAGDPPTLVADNRRILETLSWRPRHGDLASIVASALAWERTLQERGLSS